jgi:hypothetical protein
MLKIKAFTQTWQEAGNEAENESVKDLSGKYLKGNNPSSHIGHRPYGREMKGKRDYTRPARSSLS